MNSSSKRNVQTTATVIEFRTLATTPTTTTTAPVFTFTSLAK